MYLSSAAVQTPLCAAAHKQRDSSAVAPVANGQVVDCGMHNS